MALTQQVKQELAAIRITKPGTRAVEVATMLRFAGGIHIVSGSVVIEAEFDSPGAARRLREAISDLYSFESELMVIKSSGIRRNTRYVVRIVKDGPALARRVGLLDGRGRPVRGLPPAVVSGSDDDQVAVWRAAFLARGSLTEPGRSMSLEVGCPSSESALALVGAARRLGISAKAREVRQTDRVQIRDGEAIANMLNRLGVFDAAKAWEDRRSTREARGSANRLANFDDANLRRSVRAAVAAGIRVARALEILGEDVPAHLKEAGQLRLEHKHASLEELGALHDPPLTKDAIAGRIRRFLAMADKEAQARGIPNTEASLTKEAIDEGAK